MINQILLVAYVVAIVLLSIKLRQGTFSGFVLSNRNIAYPAVIGIAYTAAYFSAASFLGGGGYGLIAGMPWVVFCAFFHVAFACLAWLMAGKIWSMAIEYDAKTVPQLLEKRYNSPKGKVILAAIMLLLYTVYLVPIFKGCATLFQGLIGVSYLQGLIIAVAIVAIYYAIGGLPAIIWIGFIQGVLMLVGAIFLYSGLFNAGGGTEHLGPHSCSRPEHAGPQRPLAKDPGPGLFHQSRPSGSSRPSDNDILSQRQEGGPFCRRLWADVHCHLCSLHILPGHPGLRSLKHRADSTFSEEPRRTGAIPRHDSILPPGFDSIILLAAISAAMSTMSAIVLVTTTSLTSDILRYLHPEITDRKILLLTRVVGVMILMIAAVSAVNVPQQIVPLVSVSMGVIACCVFVPLIFGLYWERGTQTGFIASLLASFFSVVAWNFYGNPLIHPVFIGLVCGTAAYVIGSLATRGARRAQSADQSKAA